MRDPRRLDALRIITPCDVPWSTMKGDDARRFCGRCRQNVYDVAALSAAEAIALIERAEGRICLRLTRRPDGTIVTGDCWAILRRARRRGLLAFAAALPVVLVATLWAQTFGLRALFGVLRDGRAPWVTAGGAVEPLPQRTMRMGFRPSPPPSPTMGAPAPSGAPSRPKALGHIKMGKTAPSRDLR